MTRTIFAGFAATLLIAGVAIAQPASQPAKPTYEQLQHQIAVAQEVANTYYMRAIQAEAQLTQLRAEQAISAKEATEKQPKK